MWHNPQTAAQKRRRHAEQMLITGFPSGAPLLAFLTASVVLAIIPGPGVLYIVTRSMSQGHAAGLASVAGVACGNLANSIIAALGLSALFSLSTQAFWAVKYAGAAYLMYLGIRALRRTAGEPPPQSPHRRPAGILRDGFLVALLNPKTALFFSAFLPQFVDPRSWSAATGLALGATFVLIASITDAAYALAAGSLAPALTRYSGKRTASYLTAGVFFGLGVFAAACGSRPSR